ncbi:unnamed protein product, partial [Protopolystoma xenopodis]
IPDLHAYGGTNTTTNNSTICASIPPTGSTRHFNGAPHAIDYQHFFEPLTTISDPAASQKPLPNSASGMAMKLNQPQFLYHELADATVLDGHPETTEPNTNIPAVPLPFGAQPQSHSASKSHSKSQSRSSLPRDSGSCLGCSVATSNSSTSNVATQTLFTGEIMATQLFHEDMSMLV